MNFKQCAHIEAHENAKRYIVAQPCKNDTMGAAFCPAHTYCAELLELAAMLNYPRFVAAYAWNSATQQKDIPVLYVGADRENWQAYAERHADRHHNDMMYRLQLDLRRIQERMEEERRRNAIIKARESVTVAASAA